MDLLPEGIAGGLVGHEELYRRGLGGFVVFLDPPAANHQRTGPGAVAGEEPVERLVLEGRVDAHHPKARKLGRKRKPGHLPVAEVRPVGNKAPLFSAQVIDDLGVGHAAAPDGIALR